MISKRIEKGETVGVHQLIDGVVGMVDEARAKFAENPICLQVGRPKDHDRVIRFVEAGTLDAEIFEAILVRHDLMEKWRRFQQTYFSL